MKKIGYFALGLIFYWTVKFIFIWVGSDIGYGPTEAGNIGGAILVFFAIIIICILIIVKVNKNNK